MTLFRKLPFVATLAAALVCRVVGAADDVARGMITLNDNAGWSWFEDERAIINPVSGELLVSSAASFGGPNGGVRSGDIDIVAYKLATGVTTLTVLKPQLQSDDHNSAAIIVRPDGRYLAMYGQHSTGGEVGQQSFYRISSSPNDGTAWGAEQSFDNNVAMTYSNLHYLPADNGGAGRMYNFLRTANYDPNVLISNNQGTTWTYGGKLLTEGGGSDRPYVRYWTGGDRVHFITTNRHPRNFDNSIYYGYVRDAQLYNSQDAVLDTNLFDATAVAPSALTPVFQTGTVFGGQVMRRGWTVDVSSDASNNPVVVFQARRNDLDTDHRFFYGRWDGAAWQVNQLGYAGSYLYAAENDYTGLVSIDPSNPNIVYVSSEVHPATQAQLIGADGQRHYELFKGQTADNGVTWSWTPITFNSRVDNIRPLVPRWDASNTALLWMRGDYATYTNYNTSAAALVNPDLPAPQLALAVDFGANGQTLQAGYQGFTRAANPAGLEQTEVLTSPFGVSGQVTVTIGGGDVQFADLGDDVAAPLGRLAEDYVSLNGDMTLKFDNLLAGNYQLVLYAHDRNVDQATYDIRLAGKDLGTLNPVSGATPTIGIASSRVAFKKLDAGSFTLLLDSASAGATILNGFELYRVEDYTIALPPIDLNADGELDLLDFQLYLSGLNTDLSGLTSLEAYQRGDLNGDFANNFLDFRLFQAGYDEWNGAGAFAAALAVPEPALGHLVLLAALIVWRRPRTSVAWGLDPSKLAALGLIGACSLPTCAGVTYVDASLMNTTPGSAFATTNLDDNLWGPRTGVASGSTVFQSGDGNGENAPEITTTLTGLTPLATYRVYAHFWDAAGGTEAWSLRAGFPAGAMTHFANPSDAIAGATGAALASTLAYDVSPTLLVEDNRTMFAGLVGQVSASAAGQLSVRLDDRPSTIGVNNRTWYDGLSYERLDVLTLRVNSVTGVVSIRNATAVPISLDYYELRSATGALNPVGWTSLDSQEAGDPVGVGWDSATTNTANVLSEVRLLTPQTVAPGSTLILGTAFTLGGADNLAFSYGVAGGAVLDLGAVEYVTSGPAGIAGDFNNDGQISAADYTKWRDNSGAATEAGINYNGDGGGIAASDYTMWSMLMTAPASAAASTAAVPEPTGWLLVAGCVIAARLYFRTSGVGGICSTNSFGWPSR